MENFRFHHYVKDKDGNIEIEIFATGNNFSVHFPRYEMSETEFFHHFSCFAEMKAYQVGMLIFAYDEKEFYRFQECYKEERKKQFPDWAAQYMQLPIR